jgi:hypothetical protein
LLCQKYVFQVRLAGAGNTSGAVVQELVAQRRVAMTSADDAFASSALVYYTKSAAAGHAEIPKSNIPLLEYHLLSNYYCGARYRMKTAEELPRNYREVCFWPLTQFTANI